MKILSNETWHLEVYQLERAERGFPTPYVEMEELYHPAAKNEDDGGPNRFYNNFVADFRGEGTVYKLEDGPSILLENDAEMVFDVLKLYAGHPGELRFYAALMSSETGMTVFFRSTYDYTLVWPYDSFTEADYMAIQVVISEMLIKAPIV